MAATGTPTPNLGLRIPVGTDPASVDDINYNSNLLDTKLGAIGNDSVQDQIDTLNSKITNQTVSGANFVLKNCTYELTTNNVQVRSILDGQMLFIRVQARGKITAIGNPAYSIIQVNGLSGLNNYTMQRALTSMREYDAAFEVDVGNVVLSGVDSSSLYIQFQRVGGTSVNNWKTTNLFYIDVSAMIVL